MTLRTLICLLPTVLACAAAPAYAVTPVSADSIRTMVVRYKADPRGPFQGIRWFCPDGTVRGPQDRCAGGNQHALIRDSVADLGRRNGVYLGQILTNTDPEAFLDAANAGSRLKQYQIERFLQGVDDGWILRQARYYRGAFQAEDEDAWGKSFLVDLVGRDSLLTDHFLLCRESVKDIPHAAGDSRWPRIRTLARVVGDSLPSFTKLRIKIHGQPERADLDSVRVFMSARRPASPVVAAWLDSLEMLMTAAYRPPDFLSLLERGRRLGAGPGTLGALNGLAGGPAVSPDLRAGHMADALWEIRSEMVSAARDNRLGLMDLSIEIERALFTEVSEWAPRRAGFVFRKAGLLTRAAVGCGYLEPWEWRAASLDLDPPGDRVSMPLPTFVQRAAAVRRAVNWAAGMLRAHYGPAVDLFAAFEPLALGFVDDRARGSILLPLGDVAARLGRAAAQRSGLVNTVAGSDRTSEVTGLNPGFARGVLEVIPGNAEGTDFRGDRIYAMDHPPADMKPVRGVATVTEGNAVSHVQLLARNLGIPNAQITSGVLADLAKMEGREVFYAVSPRGRVIIKPAESMTETEIGLFSAARVIDSRIAVPTDRLDLERQDLPSLLNIRAADSGRLCGPKAANLGELRSLFPDRVSAGFVIPFGVFRRHLEQPMPGQQSSYHEYLVDTFATAAEARNSGAAEGQLEEIVLPRLAVLRAAIRSIRFLPDFVERFEKASLSVLGAPPGEAAVFVRSDTNMEDLKDFVGAGLNLTVANVVGREALMGAIRDVWASPFTERSYRWRQQYLLNPEHVYPSLLVMESVSVEKSGVMITTGIGTDDPRDLTVAFNRGTGGAVEGQAAEVYTLHHDGRSTLLNPARDTRYTILPTTGGTAKRTADFSRPILSLEDKRTCRLIADEVRRRLRGIGTEGPYDVELGFLGDKAWLFQVRPFVESKRARSSTYLSGLDGVPPTDEVVRMDLPLE